MKRCDLCKVHESAQNSKEPSCCKWYMDNVVIGDKTIDSCTDFEPIDDCIRVVSNICPNLTGHILRWVTSETFIALVTNRFGSMGEMICHKDCWTIC